MVTPNTVPFQVSLTYNDRFECGGSILSSSLILTAAHCVADKTPKYFRVTAGEHNRTGFHIDPNYLNANGHGTRQTRIPKYIFIHEGYNDTTLENDIAIMLLTKSFVFGNSIQQVRLPENGQQFQGYLSASGWGAVAEGCPPSEVLRKVRLPIVSNEKCASSYNKTDDIVTNHMICAGQAGLDACQGDSGGPAICEDHSVKTLCGIISQGRGCGRPGYPGIFTRVASYVDWINTTILEKIPK